MISLIDLKKNSSRILNVDENERLGLKVYHFDKCDDTDNDVLKQARGIIIKNDNEIISMTFGYTPEWSNNEINKIEKFFEQIDMTKCLFFESHEGCLIRCLFEKESKDWMISTHRRLNAFESRWGSNQSFGDMFVTAIYNEYKINNKFHDRILKFSSSTDANIIFEHFIDSLDKSKEHLFFIRNTFKNYIVCTPPTEDEHQVYYIGSHIDVSPKVDFSFDDLDLVLPKRYTDIQDVKSLIEKVENIDPFKLQGIVVFIPNENGFRLCKVVNDKYAEFTAVRGNEANLYHRYLTLRSDPKTHHLVDKLCYLYPHFVSRFDNVDYIISILVNNMYKAYIDRFVKKQHIVIPKEEYKIVKECFDWYCQDTRRRISRRVIASVFIKQTPQFQNQLIKKYNERKDPTNAQFSQVSEI